MNNPFDLFTPTFNANKFKWSGNSGVTNFSNFSGRLFSKCWNNRSDFGMTLYSPKTGNFIEFVLVDTVTTIDNPANVLHWVFKSICGEFDVTIYNDASI